jgi:hypothetical protein
LVDRQALLRQSARLADIVGGVVAEPSHGAKKTAIAARKYDPAAESRVPGENGKERLSENPCTIHAARVTLFLALRVSEPGQHRCFDGRPRSGQTHRVLSAGRATPTENVEFQPSSETPANGDLKTGTESYSSIEPHC